MSNIFEDAVDATLNGWTINGNSLKGDADAKQKITSLLRSLNFDTWLSGELGSNSAAALAADEVPIWYSGLPDGDTQVADFKKLLGKKGLTGYTIGDTAWGQFVQGLDGYPDIR
jgi:hypothetical protein